MDREYESKAGTNPPDSTLTFCPAGQLSVER